MKLRTTIHRPPRFGDTEAAESFERPDQQPQLPERAIPFNPNLPEAAFPTLEWPVPLTEAVKAPEPESMDPDDAMDLDVDSQSPAQNEETQSFQINDQGLALDDPGEFVRDPMNDLSDSEEEPNTSDLTVSSSDLNSGIAGRRWKSYLLFSRRITSPVIGTHFLMA